MTTEQAQGMASPSPASGGTHRNCRSSFSRVRDRETVYRLVDILRAESPWTCSPTDYRIEEQTLPPPPSLPRRRGDPPSS